MVSMKLNSDYGYLVSCGGSHISNLTHPGAQPFLKLGSSMDFINAQIVVNLLDQKKFTKSIRLAWSPWKDLIHGMASFHGCSVAGMVYRITAC